MTGDERSSRSQGGDGRLGASAPRGGAGVAEHPADRRRETATTGRQVTAAERIHAARGADDLRAGCRDRAQARREQARLGRGSAGPRRRGLAGRAGVWTVGGAAEDWMVQALATLPPASGTVGCREVVGLDVTARPRRWDLAVARVAHTAGCAGCAG